jgi:hypothetical protein
VNDNVFNVIYFKRSGKYYSHEDRVNIDGDHMQEIVDNFIADCKAKSRAPGLAGLPTEFFTVILDIEPNEFGYPCMIPPDKWRD